MEEKQIEKRCDLYLKDFTNRLERLEKEVKDKCDPAKVKEIVREEINAIPKAAGNKVNGSAQDSVINSTVKELADRKARETNIVMFNAPEPNSNLKEEVRKTDIQFLWELGTLCETNIDAADVSNGIRLGQKKEA